MRQKKAEIIIPSTNNYVVMFIFWFCAKYWIQKRLGKFLSNR